MKRHVSDIKTKLLMVYFWSFSIDLVSDLLIRRLILLFPQKFIKTGLAIPTASLIVVSQ